jgi:methylthioribose-1-phosphate isomerase
MSKTFETVAWQGDIDGHLVLLDQTQLPTKIAYIDCRTVTDVVQAIQRLSVRGAPAIGVAAAYGVCIGIQKAFDTNAQDMRLQLNIACDMLEVSRPTAVNLSWAIGRMRERAERLGFTFTLGPHRSSAPFDPKNKPHNINVARRLLQEAKAIDDEDRQMCHKMAHFGADLLDSLPVGSGILTHCNTGALVSGSGNGTALAVIFELARRGKQPRVFADETRPLLQGARLTMWELMQRGTDCTLICDSVAAQVMREGRIQAVITGADRIAANGDTANKIGTYSVATLARAHNIPFYVAAPATTFDLSIATGAEIPIEQRADDEITQGFGKQTAPAGAKVYNPAFDVTPAELIAAIITDRGVIQPVNTATVRTVLG